MLLARTDWDVPKHAGISFFVVPMDIPGIEVRPIRQMTGESDFNEVFLTDVRIPASMLIGELNNGWRVLQGLAIPEQYATAHREAFAQRIGI
jgi:alkylation response protein AidB-like acyl-CoA dehydrogenase